jgi:hypothetical protein
VKNYLLAVLLFALCVSTATAGTLQNELKSNWLGAWVVVKAESYSDCSGMYTNNRINGNLVKSRGSQAFESGELAKLQKVDAKRSRLDLMLVYQEPTLISYQDGPFTLYNEAYCKVELEIELPRQLVKSKNVAAVEEYVAMIVERHTNRDSAEDSDLWNMRERASYPDDYDITLAKHSVWKAEQLNAVVDAKLNTAVVETSRVIDRVSADPAYLDHFAQGVIHAREHRLEGCPALLGFSFASRNDEDDPGYVDGLELTHGLELMRRLPGCYVQVPDPPILHEASRNDP